jgi:hypothetical protein
VFHGAPPITLDPAGVNPPSSQSLGELVSTFNSATNDVALLIDGMYAEGVVGFVQLLENLILPASDPISALSQQLQQVMQAVGVSDYLALLRRMDDMRGNATTIIQTLQARQALIANGDSTQWYDQELQVADVQLHDDINALLDPSEGYFTRTYVESVISGNWMTILSDRPDINGQTFDYRLGLSTVMFLIPVRLSMMYLTAPDFVSAGIFVGEMLNWWTRLQQLSDQMSSYIRTIFTPIALQSSHRLAVQMLGQYFDWQTHFDSIAPDGAVDITTGYNIINWDYTQFDEWYLAQGNLHGRNAGYWNPSIGPNWYQPSPNATGLPPLNSATIQEYYNIASAAAVNAASQVVTDIGAGAASVMAWTIFALAQPGVPTQV